MNLGGEALGGALARQVLRCGARLLNVYGRSFGTTLDKFHGEPAYRLPLSARYVVDPQGRIPAADVSADHTVRPDPEETLAQLRALSANSERQQPKPRMRM